MESSKLKDLIEKYLKETKKYTFSDLITIASNLMNINKNTLYLSIDSISLNKNEYQVINNAYDELIKNNKPYQYVLGYKDFYNERYIVNESVLIPRDDTEILVEKACSIINKYDLKNLLDMCTGSGAIGISIANNSNISCVDMVDISNDALKVADENIKLNNVESKCKTINSDLFQNLKAEKKYDMLTSNPPYIKTDVINTLEKDVQNEPLIALDGGPDGLSIYRKILNDCQFVLKDSAFILLEIGFDQKDELKKLIASIDYLEYLETLKDLSNNDRVVICRFHQI